MSKDEELIEEPKKQKKGFALPENRKNISKAGRPKGSKNKIPSNEEFSKQLLGGGTEAFEKIMSIIRKGDDKEALKASIKMLDLTVKIYENGGKLYIEKDPDGEEPTVVEVEKEDNVVKFKTLGK